MKAEGTGPRRWGFAATIVLALAAWGVSVLQVERAREEVRILAQTADRSTFLVGEVGRHLSRLRATALERLALRDRDLTRTDEDVRAVAAGLDEAVRELEPLLQPEEERRWSHFVPLLGRFRHHVDAAMAAAARGEVGRARAALVDEVNPLAVQLQAKLDELRWLNEDQSAQLLATADATLGHVVLMESVLGLGLLVGLAVVWWTVLGTLARQRQALEEYVTRIESSNRDLDAFAGRIAHDVRNALAPVGFGAAALRHGANRPEAIARIAGQLERSVQRTGSLIDGLLAFSRMGAGVAPVPSARLAPTVESVLEEVAPLVARVDARLDVDLRDATVACPPGLLHVVAANLIGNALKFLEGRAVRQLTVAARRLEGGWCELVVADTGPGIPRESLPRIFEPFYRVPGTAVEGTGIGLATVRRIVSAHGGRIDVESEVGRGTAFRVRLVLHEPHGAGASDAALEAGA